MPAARFNSVFRDGLFDDQVIFVTGGGTGIGRCTAHELASLGAHVVIGARHRDALDRTAAEITEGGGRCDVVEIDIRDEASVDRAVSEIVERHGRIDGLVNNAGGQFVSNAADLSAGGWRAVIDLNLTGTFLVTRAVYDRSMKERGGAIVNMLADMWTGFPGMVHTGAARAAVENLTRTLSLEWSNAGIRINGVAPGVVLSSGMLSYPEAIQQVVVKSAKDAPLARLATESEVSAAIVFLLSPAAAYISGETICIDGASQYQKPRLIRVGRHDRSKPWNGFHLRPDFSGTPFAEFDAGE